MVSRRVVAGVAGTVGLASCALAAPAVVVPAIVDRIVLAGRLGGTLDSFDTRYPSAAPAAGAEHGRRRTYVLTEGRALVDLTPDGRARQVTFGRERSVHETWEPAPGDWTLEESRALAGRWLPLLAAFERTEPFVFRDQVSGQRDVYRSAALGRVLTTDAYAAAGAAGPPGMCHVTHYQTRSGGVAFLLTGLY